MRDQIVSLEVAKLAKEKGFDKPTLYRYSETPVNSDIILVDELDDDQVEDSQFGYIILAKNHSHAGYLIRRISAPTQTEFAKWLRIEKGFHVVIIPTVESGWTFKTVKVLSKMDDDVIKGIASVDSLPPYKDVHMYDYNTPEEALDSAFIEILKQI